MSETNTNITFNVADVVFNQDDELNVQAEGGTGVSGPRLPSFSAVAYTGGAMTPQQFSHPVVIDLNGIKPRSKQVPIRLFHDREQGLGHATKVKPVDGALIIEGVFSRDTPQAKEVVSSALNGYPWQLSVGGRAVRREWIEAGVSVKANGKTFRGPLEHIFEFELAEVSFCDVAADSKTFADVKATLEEGNSMSDENKIDASVDIDAAQNDDQVDAAKGEEKKEAPPFLKKEGEDKKTDEKEEPESKDSEAKTSDAEKKDAKAGKTKATAPDEPVAASAPCVPVVNVNAAAPSFDSERLAELLQTNANRIASINSIEASGFEDLRAQAIDENWSYEDFKTALVKARHEAGYEAASSIPSNIKASSNMQQKQTCDVVEAAIVTACLGQGFAEKHYDSETLNRAYDNKKRLSGFQDVFSFSTDSACYRSDLNDMNYVQAAFTTSGLERVFRNVVNKALLAGYETVDDSWRKLCSISRAQDFKPVYNYRTSGNFTFEKLAHNGGTIENARFSEQEYTNRVSSYAIKYSLSREMLYNDDLNALVQFPTKLGMGAAERLNDEVWKCILADNVDKEDGANFFSEQHANYLRYTSENNVELSFASLSQASDLFESQVTKEGRPIAQVAKYLVVPSALKQVAWRLLNSVTLNESTAIGIPQGVANPFNSQYQYEIVSTPYLQTKLPGFERGSRKSWYLFGDPNRVSAFDVVFLNGQERPTIEQGQATFDQLGVQYRGYFDFGVSAQDYRGAVYVDCRED